MYEHDPPPFPARVFATVALFQAGLERAARRAGLSPVGPTEPAMIALHVAGEVVDAAIVDVSAGPDHVTLTLSEDLGPEAWAVLHRLVSELLGTTDRR